MTKGNMRTTQPVETVVVVKCVSCKATREVHAGEVAPDDVPLCQKCFSVMVVQKAIRRPMRNR